MSARGGTLIWCALDDGRIRLALANVDASEGATGRLESEPEVVAEVDLHIQDFHETVVRLVTFSRRWPGSRPLEDADFDTVRALLNEHVGRETPRYVGDGERN
jgi:hypothetical protein